MDHPIPPPYSPASESPAAGALKGLLKRDDALREIRRCLGEYDVAGGCSGAVTDHTEDGSDPHLESEPETCIEGDGHPAEEDALVVVHLEHGPLAHGPRAQSPARRPHAQTNGKATGKRKRQARTAKDATARSEHMRGARAPAPAGRGRGRMYTPPAGVPRAGAQDSGSIGDVHKAMDEAIGHAAAVLEAMDMPEGGGDGAPAVSAEEVAGLVDLSNRLHQFLESIHAKCTALIPRNTTNLLPGTRAQGIPIPASPTLQLSPRLTRGRKGRAAQGH